MNSRLSRQWVGRILAAGFIVGAVWVHESGEPSGSVNAAGIDRPSAAKTNAPPAATPATNATPTALATPVKSPPMPDIKLSPALAEVVKMIQAGVSDEVLSVYISNATNLFQVGLDQILYLNDIGVSSQVITALMQHDKQFTQSTTPESIRAALAGATNAAPVLTPKTSLPPAAPVPAAGVAVATAPVTAPPPQEPAYGVPTDAPQPGVAGAPAEVNSTYNYFSTSLSPYGSWLNVGDYGWCWQPTVVVVNPGWRPYYDRGRWAYTDCGWYWLSDYSWGWATFHYGRWHSHPAYGWLWVPGSVWSPAWVSWRWSGSYCGWAPLPPAACYRSGLGFSYYGSSVGVSFEFGLTASHYTFIPLDRFCDYYPHRYAVSPGSAHNVYNQTIVANNFIQGNNNNIVINRSIPPDQVAAATRTEIRKATVRELASARGAGVKPERLDKVGSDLVIFRPQAPQTAASEPDVLSSRISRQEPPKQRTSTAGSGAPTATGAPTRNAPGSSSAAALSASGGPAPAVPGIRSNPTKPVPSALPSSSVPPTRVEVLADAAVKSDVASPGAGSPRREPELGLKPYGQRPSTLSRPTVPSSPQTDAAISSDVKTAPLSMAPVPANRPAYRPRPVPAAPSYGRFQPAQPSPATPVSPGSRVEAPEARVSAPLSAAAPQPVRPTPSPFDRPAAAPAQPAVTYSAPAAPAIQSPRIAPATPQAPAAPAYQPYSSPNPAPAFRPQPVQPPQPSFPQRPAPSVPTYVPPPVAPPPAPRPPPAQPAYRPEPSAPAYRPPSPPPQAPSYRHSAPPPSAPSAPPRSAPSAPASSGRNERGK